MEKAWSSRMLCDEDGEQVEDRAMEMKGELRIRRNNPSRNPAAGLSEVRAQKILRLRRSIADGTYRISAAEVARKLIWHVQFLS